MYRLIEALVALPHRGSATPEEAQAAARLEAYLAAHGHAVERQAFRAPRTYGWELFAISALLAVGGVWPSLGLALVGAYWFWAYFGGWGVPWSGVFDRYPSQNLIARAGAGPRTLVLMAHYDTAKTWFLYHPRRVRGFRTQFLINALLATLVPLLLLAWPLGARVLDAYFAVQGVLLLYREARAPYVNGANDNASGVAVATRLFVELARRVPKGWRVVLALTGAEEVGAKGARALLRAGKVPRDALILNIDNVGRGALHFVEGEGMLRYYPYRGALVQAARTLEGARPVAYTLAYFDTLPFARAGYACLGLIRLQDGVPPHWHWPTDRMAHLDYRAVEETLAYARALVDRVLQDARVTA
nr:M28 family peptidase [Marinithermus hydrothermalis]